LGPHPLRGRRVPEACDLAPFRSRDRGVGQEVWTHTLGSLDTVLAWASKERPGHTALLEHVLAGEVAAKSEQRINRRIQTSGLIEKKTLEAFDWDFQPGLDRSFIVELGRLDFVRRRDDIVITGKSGTGKSHILKALGLRACEQRISVRYARCCQRASKGALI
jgi:DNA replication protein DnaC